MHGPSTALALLVLAAVLPGCGEQRCEPRRAVVTDIDETLTVSNSEWLAQFQDASYDPEMRPDADVLMRSYRELGYRVYYVTARGEDLALPDGRSARRATEDWLDGHGFPREAGSVFLAEGIGVFGARAAEYKTAVLEGLQAEGWTFEYAYGNAESDIEAFQAALIPDERIFLVGRLAGTLGVVPMPDDEAFTRHVADHLPSVPAAACP